MKAVIYALCDPRTGSIRYVGKAQDESWLGEATCLDGVGLSIRTLLLSLLLSLSAFASEITLGPGDDIPKALASLEVGSVITLKPGDYESNAFYIPPARAKLKGAGIGRTIIHKHGRYAAIQNQQAGSNGIEVSDLSIDCSGESFMGVCLFGSNNVVRNVQVYNHVSPVYPGDETRQESFAILLTVGTNNLIENCLVTDFKGGYNGGLVIAPGTGTIRNSKVIGAVTVNAELDLTMGAGATVVEGCEVSDVAMGTYTEGFAATATEQIIRNNVFRRCRIACARLNLYAPQDRFIFENNHSIDSYGFVVAHNENIIGYLDIRANTFTGKGKWLDIGQARLLRIENNLYSPGMSAMVQGSTGKAGQNESLDGKMKIRDGELKSAKPGKSQLKEIQASLN